MSKSAKASSPRVPRLAKGRILGIDYGRRRIGLAISDPGRTIASPLSTYVRQNPERDSRYFRDLVAQHEVAECVVGIPVHMSGEESEMAAEARRFGQWLAEVTGLPVAYWDERYTTREADVYLAEAGLSREKRRARRDKLAAQILLQAFLDRGAGGGEGTLSLEERA